VTDKQTSFDGNYRASRASSG